MSGEGESVQKQQQAASSVDMREADAAWTKLTKQLFASVFFGVASISIITINKAVLTTFE